MTEFTPAQIATLRADVAAGAGHECWEWRMDGKCQLCDRELPMCGRCYDTDVPTFPANCAEKPEALAGAPIGMYHCPDCGAMVLAGLPHPDLCQRCLDRAHPGFDGPEGA